MAFCKNPVESCENCFALIDNKHLLHKDGSNLDFNDLQELDKMFPEEDFFSEPDFNVAVKKIPSEAEEKISEKYKIEFLREYFARNEEEKSFFLFRGKAMANWRSEYKFCPVCGGKLVDSEKFSARECSSCKKLLFPRIEPCVIVLVQKDGKILLAKHSYRNQDIYACIAGFMEGGESAEAAVAREVFEETGLKIKNIKYRGSQSWPFPDQLMLGFTADWESGEIKLQEEEIADAQWFDRDNCPASPKPGSIAYKLIHNLF